MRWLDWPGISLSKTLKGRQRRIVDGTQQTELYHFLFCRKPMSGWRPVKAAAETGGSGRISRPPGHIGVSRWPQT